MEFRYLGRTGVKVSPLCLGAQLQELLPALNMSLSPEEPAACGTINPPGSVVANFFNTAGWMKMRV